MATALRQLVCGEPQVTPFELEPTFRHLGSTLDFFVQQLQWVCNETPERFSLLGPFMGRSILEISMTVLVGRFDPFRLLTLKRLQVGEDYLKDLGKRRSLAIQWTGDVIPGEKSGDPDQDTEFSKIPRALLGDYYDKLIWRPAFERFLDTKTQDSESPWLTDLKNTPPGNFTPSYRSRIRVLYSTFSKGVHHEFIVPPIAPIDPVDTTEKLNDALRIVGTLGLISSWVPYISNSLPVERALALFGELQDKEQV
jgi:hypothetical protein